MKYARRSMDKKIIHITKVNRAEDGIYTCPNCNEVLIARNGQKIQSFAHKHQEGKYFKDCEVNSEAQFKVQEGSIVDTSHYVYKFYIGYLDRKGRIYNGSLFYGTEEQFSKSKFLCNSVVIDKIRM